VGSERTQEGGGEKKHYRKTERKNRAVGGLKKKGRGGKKGLTGTGRKGAGRSISDLKKDRRGEGKEEIENYQAGKGKRRRS